MSFTKDLMYVPFPQSTENVNLFLFFEIRSILNISIFLDLEGIFIPFLAYWYIGFPLYFRDENKGASW